MRSAYGHDPFALLGLKADATAAEVRRAFRSMARRLHPDVSDAPESQDRFIELVSAVEAIQSGARFAVASQQSKAPNLEIIGANYIYRTCF